jgi:hypothetical protein
LTIESLFLVLPLKSKEQAGSVPLRGS